MLGSVLIKIYSTRIGLLWQVMKKEEKGEASLWYR